jgi:hypothetical protein
MTKIIYENVDFLNQYRNKSKNNLLLKELNKKKMDKFEVFYLMNDEDQVV